MCGSAARVSAWRGGAEIIVKGCDFVTDSVEKRLVIFGEQ